MVRLAVLVFILGRALIASGGEYSLFAKSNLVAWCIVPFDAKKRGPEERAQMLERLGIRRFAYDWRAEHIPTFDQEIDACRKHNIEITAWWFPEKLDANGELILRTLRTKNIQPHLWVMGGGAPTKTLEEQTARIKQEADRIRPIAAAALDMGCKVGLYNHGGWFGDPDNQLAVLKALNMPNVGLIYNFHHAHDQMDRFSGTLEKIKPHLYCININGMVKDGDQIGKKILTIGEGDREAALLKLIQKSGWTGPIGILNHLPEKDAEEILRANLGGLERLKKENSLL